MECIYRHFCSLDATAKKVNIDYMGNILAPQKIYIAEIQAQLDTITKRVDELTRNVADFNRGIQDLREQITRVEAQVVLGSEEGASSTSWD